MAHLKQKQISDNSCKAIIIDTLLEAVRPLTQEELSREITSLFHILVSAERLKQQIHALSLEGAILLDEDDYLRISPSKQPDFIIARLKETTLRKEATIIWLDNLRTQQELSSELEKVLSQALPIFLRSLFVKHGVLSYELLTSTSDQSTFDLQDIAHHVSLEFDETYRAEIETLLPSIFQISNHETVIEYLKHSIEKAVGYISEVISDENLTQITEALKNLTIYLDTNAVYRLLNLQGNSRYESIKETLDFCRKYGVKLKISAITKKELSSRLKYDAKVLVQFPTKTNLAEAGYRYRTSDNYVSTYWLKAATTKVSVEDYISFFQNFDILLNDEQIEIEEIEVDEEPLIERAKYFFGKLSLRDPLHEKSDAALWHDAYNFAYVQKMQKADAKNAIDTRCLFLTTDQALTSFQREDHEAKNSAPVVIAPSQLLQMFAFSTTDSGYEETFIKFFASSSLGATFKYNNDDIQEILSRIGHYNGVSVKIAERILARELVSSRYFSATDEEKEEIIYNSVSDELLLELKRAGRWAYRFSCGPPRYGLPSGHPPACAPCRHRTVFVLPFRSPPFCNQHTYHNSVGKAISFSLSIAMQILNRLTCSAPCTCSSTRSRGRSIYGPLPSSFPAGVVGVCGRSGCPRERWDAARCPERCYSCGRAAGWRTTGRRAAPVRRAPCVS